MGEKEDLSRYPANLQGEIDSEEEQQELELIYEAKGMTDAEASKAATRPMADRKQPLISSRARSWGSIPRSWAAQHGRQRGCR
jgi:hypothetical protein